MGVPKDVRSCHTALLDRYLVEGHVPAGDLRRLLKERPAVAGLAVPGMPKSTPGMAVAGRSARAVRGARVRPGRQDDDLRQALAGAPQRRWRKIVTYQDALARRRSSGSTASGSRPGSRSRTPTARPSPIPPARSSRPAAQIFFVVGRGRGAGDLRGHPPLGRGARDRQDGGGARGARTRVSATCSWTRASPSRGPPAPREIVIVSNTRLQPAIRLYEKHGFVRVPFEDDGRYVRADIKLVREISPESGLARPAPPRRPSGARRWCCRPSRSG